MLRSVTNWLQQNKRLLLITAICSALAINFWAGSRVPSLNDKATLGGDLILEDPLGFEAAYPVDPSDPVLEQIGFTTINWILTNRQGMTFGILIAAGFMTLLSLLQRRSFKSHVGNSLLGLFIGVPLGVCVNCAAPIARGLHESGTRLETTLVTMISSPTLNIVVLTMLFSLMPLYMAVTKVAMTLFFLLGLVPFLARHVFSDQLVAESISLEDKRVSLAPASAAVCAIELAEPGWVDSLVWVGKNYGRNLLYIIRLTVPLMLLAGVLGAVAITVFPWENIVELFVDTRWLLLIPGMLAVGAVGLFLPVPIAFDVAIVTALLAAGVPPVYAMVLLFTLGIFSIYSFFIIWTGISRKVAVVLSGALLSLGLVSGAVVGLYLQWDEARQQALFEEFDLGSNAPHSGSLFFSSARADTLPAKPPPGATGAVRSNASGVRVTEHPLSEASPAADKLFRRDYGEALGLVTDSDLTVGYRFMPPFQRSWPVASADIDGDGWVDLVFGTDRGVFLFRNLQGRGFEQRPASGLAGGKRVINAALVDLNNDSQPDLYLSLYRGGNHVFFNKDGTFSSRNSQSLPDLGATVADATAFGDLDLDGDLDIVIGNWTTGGWTRKPGESSRNAILWREADGYRVERLPGLPGETLSLLISDINLDGSPDILVGNDFRMPEFYYFGQGDGTFKATTRAENIFPETTFSTMSIDSGDLDNDLDLEIYTTQASGFTSTNPTNRANMLPLQDIGASCEEYDNPAWKTRCLERVRQHAIIFAARQKRNPRLCLEIGDERGIKSCLAYLLLEKSTRFDKNPGLCQQLQKEWANLAYICAQAHQPAPRYTREQMRSQLKQHLGRNMLFTRTANGAYREMAEAMDADITGWSWTAKFADLDNDEWQDLYVVNGRYPSRKRATKVFFRNQQGQRFANDTRAAGLENYLAISSYTYIDYDNDADLDIVAVAVDGPIWIYTNNTRGNAGIVFELDDGQGNRSGIGSRIVIRYGADGARHQMREIKASGGFLSFDAPRAHFGLGKHQRVSRVEVIWSTGERSVLEGDREGEFKAGHRYLIERAPAATQAPGGRESGS